jgi:hypothetical protein
VVQFIVNAWKIHISLLFTGDTSWESLKNMGGNLKILAKLTCKTLKSNKKYIKLIPDAVDLTGAIFGGIYPSYMVSSYVTPAASLIAYVATEAVKAIDIGEAISGLSRPSKKTDIRYVGNEAEGTRGDPKVERSRAPKGY